MKLKPNQVHAQKAVRDLAAQFNQTEDTNLILRMKNILKENKISLNQAGIPPEHFQLVKSNWDFQQVPT